MVSGSDVDKVEACNFKVFYGHLGSAPLIEQCPVALECKVVHVLNLGSHCLVIGQVEESYVSEDCLTDGKPEVTKINAMIYSLEQQLYLAFGQVIARAFSVGKELKHDPRN